MKTFTSQARFNAEYPDALAIYCSDGRFTHPVEDLLSELGHERLDTMTLPGGPGLFHMMTSKFGELDTVRRASSMLIDAHELNEVILIAHDGCGYYKRRFPAKTPTEIHAIQVRDLEEAVKQLGRSFPALTIRTFYANPVGGHVQFENLSTREGTSATPAIPAPVTRSRRAAR